jgi:uncharacterized protein YegL
MARINLASNPSQRTPCVLILDHSGSMTTAGDDGRTRISVLNSGLEAFAQSLQRDPVALGRVQIAAVSCAGDHAELLLDWTDANQFQPFTLRADGLTPMAEALTLSLDLIANQKKVLREYGIPYTRPWIFILSDGDPSDTEQAWADACAISKAAEQNGHVEIFVVGVGGANMRKFNSACKRPPLQLQGLKFHEMFVWLSASLGQMTRSVPGAEVELPSTSGWASAKV